MQLDIEALELSFEIIQQAEGLILLKSEQNEKLIILDEPLETETLHNGEVYIRSETYNKLAEQLEHGDTPFISNQEEGELRFKQSVEERRAQETTAEREYRAYLYSLRSEISDGDYLDYAMPREVFMQSRHASSQTEQAAQDKPAYDVHDTYVNNRLYEKNTPLNLRARNQFVCWKHEWLDGKWKKIPYNPNMGGKASSVSPKTWSNFETACNAVDKFKFDGVGIMFSHGLMGIDIDHCIDENGNISESAKEVINSVNSYTELSPSGTGVHILAFGELPGKRTRTNEFEMYCKGRFFTLTGNLYEGKFRKIPKASETEAAIKLMYDKYIDVQLKPIQTAPEQRIELTYSDEEIINKCRSNKNSARFERLWRGDWSEYAGRGEQSSADSALIGMLAYYTDDKYQLDRIFRQSGLMRTKWDEYRGDMTYGARTIESVLTAPNRKRYNPKYFYETQIKPQFQKNSASEWTTIKLSNENYVQDYPRCKNFKITKGELAGAIFFYPSGMITRTEEGYNLKVKNDFTFKLHPKNSDTVVELSPSELRKAISGQPLNKRAVSPENKQNQTQFE